MLCDLFFFFFNDTATTEIYTLSLHDALPICQKICKGSHKLSDETHTVEQKNFLSTIFEFSCVGKCCDALTISYHAVMELIT